MRETFSPDSCAAEVAHRYRQASTGSVVVNAMLPRRHCLKAHFKKNKQEGSVGVWFVWACTWEEVSLPSTGSSEQGAGDPNMDGWSAWCGTG